jgi:hypothetical protein
MMSETVSLEALGALMRRMQTDIRAITVKLDLLTRARERDLATVATRDDLRDLVDVLAAQLTEHFGRIDARFDRVDERFERVDARLDQTERSIEERLARIERLLSPEGKA